MKVIVRESKGRRFMIPVPSALVCGPAGAKAISVLSRRTGMALSYAQARDMLRAVRIARGQLGNLPLLEAEAADGTYVRIEL